MTHSEASPQQLEQTLLFGQQTLQQHGKRALEEHNIKKHRGLPIAVRGDPGIYYFEVIAADLYKVAPVHFTNLSLMATTDTVQFSYEPKAYQAKPPWRCKDKNEWMQGHALNINSETDSGTGIDVELNIYVDYAQHEIRSDYYASGGELPEIGGGDPLSEEQCIAIEGLLMAIPLLTNRYLA